MARHEDEEARAARRRRELEDREAARLMRELRGRGGRGAGCAAAVLEGAATLARAAVRLRGST